MSPASGALSEVQNISVTGEVMPLAVSPDRRFLFAGLRTEPFSFSSFAIDGSNGMLTHLGNAPAAESTPYICTDRTGRFLFAAYNPSVRSRRTV
jgi:6-phosphogluconolactonase